jgi:hypothetical protein
MLKHRRKKKVVASSRQESRAADFLTIGWMMAVLTTLVCELGGLAGDLYVRWRPAAVGVGTLSGFLLFAALVLGLIGLALTALVFKARRVRPPRGVTVFSLAVNIAPLLLLVLRELERVAAS